MSNTVIHIDQLGKSYGSLNAIRDLSFSVDRGELFGLIGPDGAGKTTLMRIVTSLLIPDAGKASMEGFDVVKEYRKIRKIVGYMPGKFSLYMDLSVEENLTFFATIFGTTIDQNYDLIKDIYVQIEPFKKRKAGNLSGGMKQKLALSCALIHKPKVLILDEPTTGVDAVSRKEFWEMLKSLKHQGITIMVSTPYMDEAGLCDRIALMQKGRIMDINTPQGVINDFNQNLYAAKAEDMYALSSALQTSPYVRTVFRFGDSIHITLPDQYSIEVLSDHLEQKKQYKLQIKKIEPTIEDCFMELMTANETK